MNVNVDWVEEQTGEAGPSGCGRHGHLWVCIDDEPSLVQGRPAGWHVCERCGKEMFLWLAQDAEVPVEQVVPDVPEDWWANPW